MLLSLHVRDFVIVDECQLDFSTGFTVFSGETGAGKSILIDALALTLGAKADASLIREGSNKADIVARFQAPPTLLNWLETQELQGDDELVILRRVIDTQGKNKAFINGTSVTQAQLRECGDFLVDIHGQHAHQQLLKPSAQRDLLDRHAQLQESVQQVRLAFRDWQTVRKQREALENNARAIELERERLQWQVDDLGRLAPQAGEWESISLEHKRLAHAAGLMAGAQASLEALSEAEPAAQSLLSQVISRLRPLSDIDPALANAAAALEGAEAQVSDAVSSLNHYLSRLELDPERLAQCEARMEALHQVARKYRLANPEHLPQAWQQAQQALQELGDSSDLESLRVREQQAEQHYLSLATQLSTQRQKAARLLSVEVTRAMQDLSMSGGRFEVQLKACEPGSYGLEEVEFQVAAHPGVSLRPLHKVASGGELARISLALSVMTSSATATPTLIFDEVDSGIGGAVAEVVGRLLKQLGQSRQVLCVTHLAQVAAKGDQHFYVEKLQQSGQTLSRIRALNSSERVEEIARMLGGLEITVNTRKAARELL
ncbi:MAG: DNA repair protein RecN [Burkholderiales bacterium]|jgi:DNA repair protein RecN (Recombination protein N)|nr:DNA repair protein RecN [Burkholderiales bacterium]MCA3161791.1 DNA repair protein RecN [Burkholderiales bacterium]MCA3163937.1 DNA repair protein RecN [Burkholderiales bacterium]MCA3165278.1 DNA repair protein RecN [Burkholderiales bacterium]MCA3170428.1 DNA repair protein RecN [Burkholderiales bacterium]